MAWFPIANIVPQYVDPDTAKPFSGAVLKAYKVNTLTAIPFATDNTGDTTVNSVALNASGNPEVSGNVVIPHIDQDYKLALYPDQDAADSDSGALWTVDDLDLMGFDSGSLNPEHATDSGTDTFVSATNTTAPAAGVQIVRDFQSANTTTTPSLDSLTITTRDGSALWANALSGPHTLQLASDSGSWLVLDPNPSSQEDPIAYTDGLVSDMVDAIHAGDSLTWHEAHAQSVSGASYATIFDLSGAVDLIGGAISSANTGFRLTLNPGEVNELIVDRTGLAGGEDGDGSRITVTGIPPAKAETGMKLEAYNSNADPKELGWRVVTR